jgi:NTE family protein
MAEEQVTNLALQGGGAHGAFSWGILDAILEDGRIAIDGISATSAGAVNAVILAQGMLEGGREGARLALRDFWWACAAAGALLNPVKRLPWEIPGGPLSDQPLSYLVFDSLTRIFSPYQFNPFDLNPLRDLIDGRVDFAALRREQPVKLFLNATNVRTGEVKVFEPGEVSLDMVMASTCLPFLFKAVPIGDHHYWDGGYTGNPALWPLIYKTETRDIVILHINPMDQPVLPTTAGEIADRINEISFNSSLIDELRAIAFVHKLIERGWLTGAARDRYKYMHIHSIRADKALAGLGVASKLTSDWPFLVSLFEKGRETGRAWLEQHGEKVGRRSSCDIHREYLRKAPPQEQAA